MPPTFAITLPEPLPFAVAVSTYWLRLNVAVTVFDAFTVKLHELPLLLSQPDQEASEDWVPGVAVNVTEVPDG